MIFQMNLNPWAGCEGYAECRRALELNSCQVLFECGYGKYWYPGDRVLPQIEHVYPPARIPSHPCHTIRLANFLADEEIVRAYDGYMVIGTEGNYSEFIRDHLQGCLVGRTVFSFPAKIKVLPIPFPYLCLVTIFACWIFSLHLLKEKKGERRKRFHLFTMLLVLLIPLWRLILIFRHGSMM